MKRTTVRLIACSMAAALAVVATPCVAQAPASGPQDLSTGDAARLFNSACAPCHGPSGDGQGRGARLLGTPQPRNFTSAVFKFRSTPTGSLPRDEDVYRTISRGVPGTWMPAWEDLLSEAERWALVRYIKGFSEFFEDEEPDPAVLIPRDPGSTPDLVREGRFVYAALKCAQCHGPLGRGDGESADELEDDWGFQIWPYDFTRGRLKNGSAPSDMYRTLVTGLTGSPMPAFERQIVAFPGGEDAAPAPQSPELATYLSGQPSAAQLDEMGDAGVDAIAERRLWALVYYVRSLSRPKGLFYWLFQENPELDRDGGS